MVEVVKHDIRYGPCASACWPNSNTDDDESKRRDLGSQWSGAFEGVELLEVHRFDFEKKKKNFKKRAKPRLWTVERS